MLCHVDGRAWGEAEVLAIGHPPRQAAQSRVGVLSNVSQARAGS